MRETPICPDLPLTRLGDRLSPRGPRPPVDGVLGVMEGAAATWRAWGGEGGTGQGVPARDRSHGQARPAKYRIGSALSGNA